MTTGVDQLNFCFTITAIDSCYEGDGETVIDPPVDTSIYGFSLETSTVLPATYDYTPALLTGSGSESLTSYVMSSPPYDPAFDITIGLGSGTNICRDNQGEFNEAVFDDGIWDAFWTTSSWSGGSVISAHFNCNGTVFEYYEFVDEADGYPNGYKITVSGTIAEC